MRYSDDDLARIARNPDIEIVDYGSGRQDARLMRPADVPAKLSEHGLQAEVIRQCRERRDSAALIFAIPNGQYRRGQRPEPGLTPGVPDLFLPAARGGYYGMFIELKVSPNKCSADQRAWMDMLREQGYHCVVVWDDPYSAMNEIERYLAARQQERISI